MVASDFGGDPEDRTGIEASTSGLGPAHFLTSRNEGEPTPATSLKRGDLIGPYRILDVLGEGGFGVVYLAHQTQPITRHVALKVIKPGMDSRQVIARFEAERQALALMAHPNVAKVFDAGQTARGLPYFVMEHVPGSPITQYCDRQKLTITQRLELFYHVCDAIQHAHTKGVIHRDIKPSNILIEVRDSGAPVPKVIDFGVAKAISRHLTEKTVFTERGQLIGTPEYMSPEQAEMTAEDIDTRSDVYSLGVLLYELLTGALPYEPETLRRAALGEIHRVIRQVDPPKPSTRLSSLGEKAAAAAACRQTDVSSLASLLKRELEWIPLKAIRKDRVERYRTAADLGDDIRRYLQGEALEAAPESVTYRTRKFLRRNRGSVVAIGMVLLFLGASLGSAGTGWGFQRAAKRAKELAAANMTLKEANQELEETNYQLDQATDQLVASIEELEGTQAALAREKLEADRRREEAEYQTYIANLLSADAALLQNNRAKLRARLDACPPELRGWEWRWRDARSDRSLLTLSCEGGVRDATFSPDGSRIVTASENTAQVWDAADGGLLIEFKGHEDLIRAVDYSPDGSCIVTASHDRTVCLWDVATGDPLTELKHGSRVLSASFNPNGLRVVTASDEAHVWDARTGDEQWVSKCHEKQVTSASFSPDGTRVLTISLDGKARVLDASSGVELTEIAFPAHHPMVQSASFSADGNFIVATCSALPTWFVKVFDSATGMENASFGRLEPALRVPAAFSPDAQRIAVAVEETLQIWEPSVGDEIRSLNSHAATITGVSFSPDGQRIVSASRDGCVRVWDAVSDTEFVELSGHTESANAVFGPDGSRILTWSWDSTARVWDAATTLDVSFSLLKHSRRHEVAPSFSADGAKVITASADALWIWEVATGEVLVKLAASGWNVCSADFSPDGSQVVTTSSNGMVDVWDAVSGTAITAFKDGAQLPTYGCLSFDRSRIVTGSDEGAVRVFDARDGTMLHELGGHADRVLHAAFSPDDAVVVTASKDTTCIVWDVVSGSELMRFTGHSGAVRQVAFSPDGRTIASVSDDRTARLWNPVTGAEFSVLSGHSSFLRTCRFNSDGSRLVTTSHDGSSRVWIPDRGDEVGVLIGTLGATFSADGTRIVTMSEPHEIDDVVALRFCQSNRVHRGPLLCAYDSVPYRSRRSGQTHVRVP